MHKQQSLGVRNREPNYFKDGGLGDINSSPQPLNRAVEAAFRLGILTIAAAGNERHTSEWVTPASAPNAITVGAIDKDWKFWDDSNHGSLVDILAPGADVLTISSETTETVRGSGTSLAAPYVAGIALCLSALENFRTVQELTDRIKGLATPGKVGGLRPNTVDLVAYNGAPDIGDGDIVFPPGRKIPTDGSE